MGPEQGHIRLGNIEALTPRGSDAFAAAFERARVEASLPGQVWDRAMVLKDIIVHTLHEPRRDLDPQYRYLRDYFLHDTGTVELVPDFVAASNDLPAVWRYLDRTGLGTEEQIDHVGAAFKELSDLMDLVFRPGMTGYRREPWPGTPIATPFAKTALAGPVSTTDSSTWTGRYDAVSQAKRVLSLAPLAMTAIERLIEAAEAARGNNAPPERLEPAELGLLRALHTELGALIVAARRGGDFTTQMAAVRNAFGRTFQMLQHTGELVVADVPPLMAAMVPTWAAYGLCSTLLGLSQGSSATVAAAAFAASGTLQASRLKNVKASQADGGHGDAPVGKPSTALKVDGYDRHPQGAHL